MLPLIGSLEHPTGTDRPRAKRVSSTVGQSMLLSLYHTEKPVASRSVLSAMDRFVSAVNSMDATVLVPSKLRDMEVCGPGVVSALSTKRVPAPLANADLHGFYLMLNEVKKELLWGPGTAVSTSSHHVFACVSSRASVGSSSSSSSSSSGSTSTINRSHSVASSTVGRELKQRCPSSDDSLGSLGSSASSNASDTESDADSMITDRDSIDDHTSHLSIAFRHHLQGLHSILHQLADSADYLAARYQEEIELGRE